MPNQPLKTPGGSLYRLKRVAIFIPAALFMGGAIVFFNLLQCMSTVILPFSSRAFRGFNRFIAGTWWRWCVIYSRRINRTQIVVSGDDVPRSENAILVVNHQTMADVTCLLELAYDKGRLPDLKWFVKDPVKYVPGIGWGMVFLDCLFVKRNWAADKDSIKAMFARLHRHNIPAWIISFSEGTRLTASKLARCQAFAQKSGLHVPTHVQVPRTKGFCATMEGLDGHLDAVYDITLGYEPGLPSLWQYMLGHVRTVQLYVRRYPVESLPQDRAARANWLQDRFQEKDDRLDHLYRHETFEHFDPWIKPAGSRPHTQVASESHTLRPPRL